MNNNLLTVGRPLSQPPLMFIKSEVGSRSLLALDVAERDCELAGMARTMRVEHPGASTTL
jgi:hypothetical protein